MTLSFIIYFNSSFRNIGSFSCSRRMNTDRKTIHSSWCCYSSYWPLLPLSVLFNCRQSESWCDFSNGNITAGINRVLWSIFHTCAELHIWRLEYCMLKVSVFPHGSVLSYIIFASLSVSIYLFHIDTVINKRTVPLIIEIVRILAKSNGGHIGE